MTNEQKFINMGFRNYSELHIAPLKIMVNEVNTFYEKHRYVLPDVISHDSSGSGLVHGIQVCLTLMEVSKFTGIPLEIHYTNRSVYDAMDLCMELGIKVLTRSASIGIMNDNDKARAQRFIDYGGVWFNSAGNDVPNNGSQTSVNNNYAISVGVASVYNRDNWGSWIVGYDTWNLPLITDGPVPHYFTHTSSATPVQAFAGLMLVHLLGMNFTDIKQFMLDHSTTDMPNLEAGERFFIMPEIKKTEIKLEIGGKAYVNGVEKPIDVPAQIISGRTMIPARFVGENLNCEVGFTTNPTTGKVDTVTLTKYGV